MKAFIWNNQLYIRAIPSKPLFRSTMVHDVVTRGDVFAIRVDGQQLTIVPGTAKVEHFELTIHDTADLILERLAECGS